ncbi:ribonuclease T2 family protein [Hyalangium gracile]|uniref:ribonuclease T2 family protein n=1 Tax=Hyalangium gracile TaxID=394092 RepID=UPI001CCFA928|nr:ribonuclease T2 [Hyalangium gracile]
MNALRSALALASMLLVSMTAHAQPQPSFDYYLLDLSWSPQYCASKGGSGDPRQCGPDKHFGFVVHGLWPQYDNGKWPQNCSTEQVPQQVVDSMLDIMPSSQLVQHEWKKHGTCSGLGVDGYFQAVRAVFTSFQVPERYRNPEQPIVVKKQDFLQDLLAANPSLTADMVAIKCNKSQLVEVGICLDKDARTPRKCGGGINFQCQGDQLRLAAKR